MGNISTKYLLYIIDKRLVPNCRITCGKLKAANDIFGISTKDLKVKKIRKTVNNSQLGIDRIPARVLDY